MSRKIKKSLLVSILLLLVLNLSMITNASTPKLSKRNLTLQVNKTATLKVTGTKKTVKWNSSKKTVATVSSKGKVTAKKVGSAVITAKIGGTSLRCKVQVVKKTSPANWKSLYRNVLDRSSMTVKGTSSYINLSIKDCYFTLVDIDQNGVKELIIKEKGYFGPCEPSAYIFTIKNGKVEYVGSTGIKQDYSNKVLISKKYKSIYNRYQVAFYCPEYYYTIKNGKLSSVKFFYSQSDGANGNYGAIPHDIPHEAWCKSYGYYIDKKKVSKSKFESEQKKYSDSLNSYTLSFNSESNRSRLLGY